MRAAVEARKRRAGLAGDGLGSGLAHRVGLRPASANYLSMRGSDRELGLRFKERLQELLGPRLLRVRLRLACPRFLPGGLDLSRRFPGLVQGGL